MGSFILLNSVNIVIDVVIHYLYHLLPHPTIHTIYQPFILDQCKAIDVILCTDISHVF